MTRLETLEPDFKETMLCIIAAVSKATGLEWIATSGRRTMKEQGDLYAQGRTAPGQIVTKAPPGSSAHNFGLGCDCAPLKKGTSSIWWNAGQGYWDAYGTCCEAEGMIWGGHFKSIQDNPHCEDPRWREERAKWKADNGHVA